MSGHVIHPVQTLREQARALEAATTIALSDPRKRTVHKLRACVRRVEAQLLLLDQLSSLPDYAKQCARLEKELRKVHREAGELRDLDVQEGLLAPRHRLPAPAAQQLCERLQRRRERRARKLQGFLKDSIPRLAAALESLLKALQPAEKLSIPEQQLCHAVRAWAETEVHGSGGELDDEHLHSIRKAAKTARYMAESAPLSRAAKRLADRYEGVQNLGGRWHDWLDLSVVAQKQLGKRDDLTQMTRERAGEARGKFLAALR